MATTKHAIQGKENEDSKKGHSSSNENRSKGSMPMNKGNKSGTTSKSHK
jgi:hypothetical protein